MSRAGKADVRLERAGLRMDTRRLLVGPEQLVDGVVDVEGGVAEGELSTQKCSQPKRAEDVNARFVVMRWSSRRAKEGRQEGSKTEDVVLVEMRDEDHLNARDLCVTANPLIVDLLLCALAAVHHDRSLAVKVDDERRVVARARRSARGA